MVKSTSSGDVTRNANGNPGGVDYGADKNKVVTAETAYLSIDPNFELNAFTNPGLKVTDIWQRPRCIPATPLCVWHINPLVNLYDTAFVYTQNAGSSNAHNSRKYIVSGASFKRGLYEYVQEASIAPGFRLFTKLNASNQREWQLENTSRSAPSSDLVFKLDGDLDNDDLHNGVTTQKPEQSKITVALSQTVAALAPGATATVPDSGVTSAVAGIKPDDLGSLSLWAQNDAAGEAYSDCAAAGPLRQRHQPQRKQTWVEVGGEDYATVNDAFNTVTNVENDANALVVRKSNYGIMQNYALEQSDASVADLEYGATISVDTTKVAVPGNMTLTENYRYHALQSCKTRKPLLRLLRTLPK